MKIIINEFDNNKKYTNSLEIESNISEEDLKKINIDLFKLINGYFETEEINILKEKIKTSEEENEIELLKQQKKDIERKLIQDRFDILNKEAKKGFDFNSLRDSEFFISINPSYQTLETLIEYNKDLEELYFESNKWIKKDIELIGFFYKKEDLLFYNRILKKDKDLYIEKKELIELLEGDKLIFNQENNDIQLIKGELRLKKELDKIRLIKNDELNVVYKEVQQAILINGITFLLPLSGDFFDLFDIIRNRSFHQKKASLSIQAIKNGIEVIAQANLPYYFYNELSKIITPVSQHNRLIKGKYLGEKNLKGIHKGGIFDTINNAEELNAISFRDLIVKKDKNYTNDDMILLKQQLKFFNITAIDLDKLVEEFYIKASSEQEENNIFAIDYIQWKDNLKKDKDNKYIIFEIL